MHDQRNQGHGLGGEILRPYFDPKVLGICESATRTGERCTRNAAVVEQRNGKEVRLCRHHRQKGAFKPQKPSAQSGA